MAGKILIYNTTFNIYNIFGKNNFLDSHNTIPNFVCKFKFKFLIKKLKFLQLK